MIPAQGARAGGLAMVGNPRRVRSLAAILLAGAGLAACATPHPKLSNRLATSAMARSPSGAGGVYKVGEPYQVAGVWYVPREQPDYDVTGLASWYGDAFNQKPTANGEIFDMGAVSAAHTTLPLPSMVEVTNLDNGRKLMVRVNDRGPFIGGRVIDLSHAAARDLGYDQQGLAHVRVRYVGPATSPDFSLRYAANTTPSRSPPRPAYAATPTSAPATAYTPPLAYASPAFAPPAAVATSTPPPIPVSSSPLPPVTAPAPSSLPIDSAPVQVAARSPALSSAPLQAPPTLLYRVQAGAFSDAANAQRVASQLASAGQALIEPVQRNGATLYRVMLPGPADEGEAWALRDRVAQLGFTDARVIRPQ
jgi:rare lipoprotein A